MPRVMDPTEPVRADHRFIRGLIDSLYKGKVLHIPKEYDRIGVVFCRMGGEWSKIVGGDVGHVGKLKRVVKLAYENGYLTKKGQWAHSPGEGRR